MNIQLHAVRNFLTDPYTLRTIVSALLTTLAFLFSPICGLAIIPGLALLCLGSRSPLAHPNRVGFFLLWAFWVYGPHFWWLYSIITREMIPSKPIALGIYGIVVVWFVLLSGLLVWLVPTRYWWQQAVFFAGYFYVVTQHSLLHVLFLGGYPLLNPTLPIINSLNIMSKNMIATRLWHRISLSAEKSFLFYGLFRLPEYDDAAKQGAAVYHLLTEVPEVAGEEARIVCASEAAFPWDLQEHDEIVSRWRSQLNEHDVLLIGALNAAECGKKHQSLLFLSKDGQSIYNKRSCVDIYEYSDPNNWLHAIVQRFVKGDLGKLVPARNEDTRVFQVGDIAMVPRICAELFVTPLSYAQEGDVIIFAMYDRWFNRYVRDLMAAHAQWHALLSGVPTVYMTPDKCLYVKRFF